MPQEKIKEKAKEKPAEKIDPLYTIFEQHLYNFQDSEQDRKTFIGNVLRDYVKYLTKLNIMIPKSLEASVFEELAIQVNTMLTKKIYGCLTLDDYRKNASTPAKRKARNRYTQLSRGVKNSTPRRAHKAQRA